MKKIILYFGILTVLGHSSFAQTKPVGHWDFNSNSNLLKASVGSDLGFAGKIPGAAEGSDYFDGAAIVRRGNYLIANTGILPKPGESTVNDFTLAMDIKLPRTDQPYTLLQTDSTNLSDAEIFIRENGRLGSDSIGYAPEGLMEANEWYRVVISVRADNSVNLYLDGREVLKGKASGRDGTLSLKKNFLIFADNDGEDNLIVVSDLRLFEGALSADEVKSLGAFSHTVEPVWINTYLQTPTPNSIYICWQTSESGSNLTYGKTSAMETKVLPEYKALESNVIWNWVKLDNLEPNTVYYYQVNDGKTDNNATQSELKKFRSLPGPASGQGHFRFAVYGDTHANAPMHTVVSKEMRKKFIEFYGENFQDSVSLVMHVGDIANGDGLPNYKNDYFDCIRYLSGNIPYMVSIGNHENESHFYYDYMKYEDFGGPEQEKYYSFRAPKALFIVLNSNIQGQRQINWLDEQLNKAETDSEIDWVFVFMHHFFHSEIWFESTQWTGSSVLPVISKYKKADLIFNGHAHHYSRGAVHEGNLRLIITGGGGSTLDRWSMYQNVVDYPEIQKSIDNYNYLIVDVDLKNKKYETSVYSLGHTDRKLNNVVIDQFYRDKSDTTRPNSPQLTNPVQGEAVNSPIILAAGNFAGRGEMMSSEFQIIKADGSFSFPVLSCQRVYENIYKDSGVPDFEPIDKNKGIDLTKYTVDESKLTQGQDYLWRVRYRNKNLQWSDWSQPGKFRTGQLSSSMAEDYSDTVIKEFKLYDNFPNPFNPATRIRFDLPSGSSVTLKIFDSMGREVATLLNGNLRAGPHQVSFDATKLSSGIYFYLFEARGEHDRAGNFRQVKKMTLVK